MILTPENKFNHAIEMVLNHEGGYSNDTDDPGGETNFGITLRFLKEVNPVFLKKIGIINPDSSAIKKLTKDQAIALYRHGFWDKYNYDAINSPTLSAKIMDTAVNVGAFRAHMFLQSALNLLGGYHLDIDGILGGHTIAAANDIDSDWLLRQLRLNLEDYYLGLIKKYPNLEKFKDGWIARALS